jgi:NurA domain
MLNNQLSLIPAKQFPQDLDFGSFSNDLNSSLSELSGRKVIFRSDFAKETIPFQNLQSNPWSSSPYQLQSFSDQPRERQIVAIDSSCVLIGETEEGSIFAGRVAIVSAQKSKIEKYYRAGPFLFYLSLKSVPEELRKNLSSKAIRAIISDNSLAERYVRLRLERSAQILFAKTRTDSIILIDGSIRSSILEARDANLRFLERTAEDNFNHLIGISKASSLRAITGAAGTLELVSKGGANFFDITEALLPFIPTIESRILVAKFSANAHVFRVDAAKSNVEPDSQVLADVKYNCACFRGYPETLRLAHHLSVFDSSTISSIRSYLSRRYRLVHVPSDDLRATILGKLV